MSHPIRCIYTETIKDVVRCFVTSLPYHIQRSNPTLTNDQIMKHVQDYVYLWESQYNEMLQAIANDISYYLNYYNVFAKGSIDEFKAIYFTGRVISKFLNSSGLNNLREFNDYVTIALLDFRLRSATKKDRKVLSKSMRSIAKQNQIDSILGAHGMYMTYKVTFNIARGIEPKTY